MTGTPKEKPYNNLLGSIPRDKNSVTKLVLIGLNIIFATFAIFQIYKFIAKNSENATNLFENGRKIVVSSKSEKVKIKELENDQLPEPLQKKTEELEAKLENDTTGGEVVNEGDEFGPPVAEAIVKEKAKEKMLEEPTKEEKVFEYNYETANLAIIVTEVGLKQGMLDYARTLPKEVTFAFSPYSDELQTKLDDSKKEDREVLLNLMFEPSRYPLEDTGPLTIQSHFEETQNVYRYQNTITDKQGIIGYLTNSDEIITHNLEVISPILLKIKNAGKFFIFYKQPVNAYLEKEAKPMAVDIASVNHLIDNVDTKEEILENLNKLKNELAEKNAKIIIAIRPYKNSIDILKKWLKENRGKDLRIAPVSYFITDN